MKQTKFNITNEVLEAMVFLANGAAPKLSREVTFSNIEETATQIAGKPKSEYLTAILNKITEAVAVLRENPDFAQKIRDIELQYSEKFELSRKKLTKAKAREQTKAS